MADQVAIVTGASRGIGFAIAQRFVAEGYKVCITGRDAQALDQAAKDLGGAEVAIGVAGKGDDADHRAAVIDTVLGQFGPVTALVNNIGINPAYGPLGSLDLGAARKMFDVNVLGTLGWAQEALRGGLADTGGSIVNISSIAGKTLSPNTAAYSASKAGLQALTACMAREVGLYGIRVNALCPGLVDTSRMDDLGRGDVWNETVKALVPLGRAGTGEDIAHAVVYLSSDEGSWVTGQSWNVDGGTVVQH